MSRALSIGFSPCPNDTFLFSALVHGRVPLRDIRFSPPFLEDVETLNRWALEARLDVSKLSFHALGHVLDNYTMLSSGAALGRGCGPLLVTRAKQAQGRPDEWTIAVPGRYTTAALLLRLFLPDHTRTVVLRFDEIMGAVAEGRVDGGVIIHESRFTYRDHGLTCIRDLGDWWEKETGLPLPLGCIAARSRLGPETIEEIQQAIRASVEWGLRQPERCRGYIRRHARELDNRVIDDHIGLYVNDDTVQLADPGRAAVEELFRRGREAGAFATENGAMS